MSGMLAEAGGTRKVKRCIYTPIRSGDDATLLLDAGVDIIKVKSSASIDT